MRGTIRLVGRWLRSSYGRTYIIWLGFSVLITITIFDMMWPRIPNYSIGVSIPFTSYDFSAKILQGFGYYALLFVVAVAVSVLYRFVYGPRPLELLEEEEALERFRSIFD